MRLAIRVDDKTSLRGVKSPDFEVNVPENFPNLDERKKRGQITRINIAVGAGPGRFRNHIHFWHGVFMEVLIHMGLQLDVVLLRYSTFSQSVFGHVFSCYKRITMQ